VQYYTKKIRLDAILKKIIKRQLPFLVGGTITSVIVTYYCGFLISVIVNSAIWMLISFIINKYYYKSTGFKDEKYLLQYGLAKINNRTKRTWQDRKNVYFNIERLAQLSAESALGLFSIAGGLMLLGISVARALVTRNITTRRKKLLGKFDRTSDYGPIYTLW
jgi:hypothetical protein